MSLTYKRLSKKPLIFLRLVGVKLSEFAEICHRLTPLWEGVVEKKKRHTSKVELVMEAAGKILSLSHTHPGRKHDFRIRKEEKPLHRDAEKYVDLGYQGLQKRTSFVILPFRRKKNQPLTVEQKNHNRQQASFRMKVEHKIRELKVFKILSETDRNFGKKQH